MPSPAMQPGAEPAKRPGGVTLALAGDTMLGRGVGDLLTSTPPASLFAPEVVEAVREADLFVLNLECCISTRGRPWPAPGKPFFFRAPPVVVEALTQLGVDCVTLANNHALDFGPEALLDTIQHLRAAGIAAVGASADLEQAHTPVVLSASGFRLAVIGVTDRPDDFENVFHGIEGPVLYDLGDFIDDYATHPLLRNDLGLLFLLRLDRNGPVWLEALPLKLEYGHTRLAEEADAGWIRLRLRGACARLGTQIGEADGRLIVDFGDSPHVEAALAPEQRGTTIRENPQQDPGRC